MHSHVFSPCGVITITTDFGHQGPFVATMKGQILTRLPERTNHRRNARSSGLLAGRGRILAFARLPLFPGWTVHVAVVDPGVGTNRDIIVVEADGYAFMAPDNGLLAPVVGRARSLDRHVLMSMRRADVSG